MADLRDKKEDLKKIIERANAGEDTPQLKEDFKELMTGADPMDLSRAEDELTQEGMPREELHGLCQVHLSLMKEEVEGAGPEVPEGHPLQILMTEHQSMLGFSGELLASARKIEQAGNHAEAAADIKEAGHFLEHLRDSISHYHREENVLFPYLEKHGVTGPPAMMWIEHDKVRELEKDLLALYDKREALEVKELGSRLTESAKELGELLSGHFFKENHILFPTALQVMDDGEFQEVRRQFDEIGYCCYTPKTTWAPETGETGKVEDATGTAKAQIAEGTGEARAQDSDDDDILEAEMDEGWTEGLIEFPTGKVSFKQLEGFLNALPVDISFVDREDRVAYFNDAPDRIFVRSAAVIGRSVQNCHPQKSVHMVNQILEEFRNGSRKEAEFWINMAGKLVHIRYFPVHDRAGEYLGCLEVTQDLTDIKRIEGEKRLLE